MLKDSIKIANSTDVLPKKNVGFRFGFESRLKPKNFNLILFYLY